MNASRQVSREKKESHLAIVIIYLIHIYFVVASDTPLEKIKLSPFSVMCTSYIIGKYYACVNIYICVLYMYVSLYVHSGMG